MTDENQKYLTFTPTLPDGFPLAGRTVLLHSCCAPCSAAIVECMLRNGMRPTVFFSNPNIMPEEEYLIRKHEIIRYLQAQQVPFVEDDYDHRQWLCAVKGLEHEPERGRRCSVCFEYRLHRAARYASEHGFDLLTTTLASSRWKDIDQINEAGRRATAQFPTVTFWEQNWRRGGLQERRGQLLRLNRFYNQRYCGCEFSKTAMELKQKEQAERQNI
jgi:predicted adenine nucleotide alpha hydrolase (AANH) superfamily ATPase